MKNVWKFGLITAVLLCAAMVMIPMVAAAGPGQGNNNMNQGNSPGGHGGFSPGACTGRLTKPGPG